VIVIDVPNRQPAETCGCPSSQEVPLNWNKWVRQIHRWLAIAFTVTVIVTFVALAQEEPVVWVSYTPLLPLALLLFTGLYLFVLPHAAKWRGGRPAAREG
jgi:heme A synthase